MLSTPLNSSFTVYLLTLYSKEEGTVLSPLVTAGSLEFEEDCVSAAVQLTEIVCGIGAVAEAVTSSDVTSTTSTEPEEDDDVSGCQSWVTEG